MKKAQKTKRVPGEGPETEWVARFERFLESPLAVLASRGLAPGTCMAIHVGGVAFFYRRENDRPTLSRVEEGEPEVSFWVPLSTMRHLLSVAEVPGIGMGTMGVAIFEYIFSKVENEKIKFRIEAGFLTLWGRGYFSVLKAGGPEVASYLTRVGFDSFTRIKEAIKNSGFQRRK